MDEEINKIIDEHYENAPLIDTEIDSEETYGYDDDWVSVSIISVC